MLRQKPVALAVPHEVSSAGFHAVIRQLGPASLTSIRRGQRPRIAARHGELKPGDDPTALWSEHGKVDERLAWMRGPFSE